MNSKIEQRYLPMTETAFYLLLALREERHGYGAMQYVRELTNGRLKIGAGTIYGTLSKMEKDGLIQPVSEYDRRKTYRQTLLGEEILRKEMARLGELVRNGKKEGLVDDER
jgi:DNA-binding PadR family transcriptional regulator